MTILRIAAAAIMGLCLTSAAGAQDDSFCARLAGQLDMHAKTAPESRGGGPEWRRDLVGLSGYLFGGAASARIGTEATEEGSDPDAIATQCTPTRKGAQCDLEGPVQLNVTTSDREASVELPRGERAVFEMRSTKLYCRNL